MKVAVVGLGLIGGSFEKASRRAGHTVTTLHHGDESGFEEAELVLVCLPPEAIVPWIVKHHANFKRGALVVDIAGIKRDIMAEFAAAFPTPPTDWTFIGGHPMAGREVSGYANSLETLFDGASMILVEDPRQPVAAADSAALDLYFRSVGFAQVVRTTAEKHDAMIAFTSQLCHIVATSYARDELVPETPGFSAGSYANMTRTATQNSDIWSSLYLSNRDALLPVVDRFIARLGEFRAALAAKDDAAMKAMIDEGTSAKTRELASR